MKTFKPNSIEAVILFILYICMQDKTISKEETKELLVTAPILNKMYLDIFGEYIAIDLQKMIDEINSYLEKNSQNFLNKNVSKFERNLISGLLTDFATQDIALLASRNAASADGLHRLESLKYKYWSKKWNID